jgi:hypothetical protein
MTLEQLQRALSVVAHLDDEAFERRAPLLYKFFCIVRSYKTKQSAAYEHSTLLFDCLNNKALQDEIVALVA